MRLPHILLVEYEDNGEVLISEPFFYNWGWGHTEIEAFLDFVSSQEETLEMLSKREDHLGWHLQLQLCSLRDLARPIVPYEPPSFWKKCLLLPRRILRKTSSLLFK